MPPFGKKLFSWLTVRSPYDLSICNYKVISHFGFEVRLLVLFVPVPGHCFFLTFCLLTFAFPITLIFEVYLVAEIDHIQMNIRYKQRRMSSILKRMPAELVTITCPESNRCYKNE